MVDGVAIGNAPPHGLRRSRSGVAWPTRRQALALRWPSLSGPRPMSAAPQELRDLLLAKEPVARDAAWARFVDRFSPLLLHTARRRAPEHDRAMDAYAHVLDRLREDDFRRLRQYAEDPRAQFTTWLTLVAQRLCVDYLRQSYGRFRAERSPPGPRPGWVGLLGICRASA